MLLRAGTGPPMISANRVWLTICALGVIPQQVGCNPSAKVRLCPIGHRQVVKPCCWGFLVM